MKILNWYTTGTNRYPVQYTYEMDGGGTTFGTEYAEVLSQLYPDRTFNSVYEWCSGPAFIGFDLIDHGIAKSLHCTDVYLPALQCVRNTALANGLHSRVQTTLLEDLSLMPATAKFDLVVGNPPHFDSTIHDEFHRNRILLDQDWKAHKNFYHNIKKHLVPGAVILMQENLAGSRHDTFSEMIDQAGLQINSWFPSKNFFSSARSLFIYYIEITEKKKK